MRRRGTVIAGYYGFGNAGDELILGALIDDLKAEKPDDPITVLSARPAVTNQHFGVKAVDRWRPWGWILAFWRADLFVLGGGGLLQESSGSWNHFYYLSTIALAKFLGCRTGTRGLGVDTLRQPFNRWLTRWIFSEFVDFISVRDRFSAEALWSIGIRLPIQIEPDLVVQWSRAGGARKAPPDRMALVVSPGHGRKLDAKDVGRAVCRLWKCAPVDLLIFFAAEDAAFAEAVSQHSDKQPRIRRWTRPEDCLKWMDDYALVVGTRFHALALAAASGRPFVGWVAERKVQSLCDAFNQPFWLLTKNWPQEDICRQVERAWEDREKNAAKVAGVLGERKTCLCVLPPKKVIIRTPTAI